MNNSISLNNSTRSQETGRVLFTGNGANIIDSIMSAAAHKYKVFKCHPMEASFMAALEKNKPHVVVICLQNETDEKLYIYDILSTVEAYVDIPVILVGYQEDCTQFTTKVPVKYLETFIRPLEQTVFSNSLRKFVTQAQRELKWAYDELLADTKNEIAEAKDHKSLIKKVQRLSLTNGRKSILVVDDDVRMLNVIKLYLEDLYDITVVPSGKLALKYLSKKKADLVLLDYMMPEMDGPDVLKQIREDHNNSDIPVLFLTGMADKEFVMRGLALKPSGYLLKPISREALLERVTEILLAL